jgi:hypothetical protein
MMQHDFQSTDPRDKIFAFLGLKPSSVPPFVIADYHKSAAEVYAEAAFSIIHSTSSLGVFAIVEGNDTWTCNCSTPIPKLPSWAPNWGQKFHGARPMSWVDLKSSFCSSRDLVHVHQSPDPQEPLTLSAKGKSVTTINRVLPRNFDKAIPISMGSRSCSSWTI